MAGYKDYVLEFKLGDGTTHRIPFRVPLGENGGYYIPAIEQISDTEIKISYVPSIAGMPTIKPAVIKIPGSGGNVEKHNTDSKAHADIRKIFAAANIIRTTNGDVIALDYSSDVELAGLKVYGKTIQNGTPTPENPVPLQSVGDDGSVDVTICGKNLLNMPARSFTANGIHYHAEGNELSFYGTATGSYGDVFLHKNILCLPAGRYTLSAVGISAISRIEVTRYSTATGTQLELINLNGSNPKHTYTLLEPCTFQFIFVVANGTSLGTADSPTTIKIQMECGDSATDFEPYKNAQSMMVSTPNGLSGIPVSSAGNYIDANGQWWVCDEVDFARGVRVQRIGKIDSYAGETVGEIYLSSTGVITYGASVLYPMEQAVEHPLSTGEITAYGALHTNYPNTTIFNDGGTIMEVKYVADTKLYVDKKFAELSTALLNQ